MKIVFLDIDGPMIPMRAMCLSNGKSPCCFDPVAVKLLNEVLEESGAKLVISSTWRLDGLLYNTLALTSNGVNTSHLHGDWRTKNLKILNEKTRTKEILEWVERHPEVDTFVAIDDMKIDIPNFIQATFEDGFLWKHYMELRKFLGI